MGVQNTRPSGGAIVSSGGTVLSFSMRVPSVRKRLWRQWHSRVSRSCDAAIYVWVCGRFVATCDSVGRATNTSPQPSMRDVHSESFTDASGYHEAALKISLSSRQILETRNSQRDPAELISSQYAMQYVRFTPSWIMKTT